MNPQKKAQRIHQQKLLLKIRIKPLESYVKSLEFNPYNDLYDDKWHYVTVMEATITHDYWLSDMGYEYKWEQ